MYIWCASRGSMTTSLSRGPSGVPSPGGAHFQYIGWSLKPATLSHVIAVVLADEETRRRGARPPDARLRRVAAFQPEGVIHRARRRAGSTALSKAGGRLASFQVLPAIGGAEDRRAQMAGGGRHQHRPAGAPVDHQMADDLAQMDRPLDTSSSRRARSPRKIQAPFAGADEKPNAAGMPEILPGASRHRRIYPLRMTRRQAFLSRAAAGLVWRADERKRLRRPRVRRPRASATALRRAVRPRDAATLILVRARWRQAARAHGPAPRRPRLHARTNGCFLAGGSTAAISAPPTPAIFARPSPRGWRRPPAGAGPGAGHGRHPRDLRRGRPAARPPGAAPAGAGPWREFLAQGAARRSRRRWTSSPAP